MANLAISGLTASASNLATTDLLPVVQTAGVGPVKMTGLQIAGGLVGGASGQIQYNTGGAFGGALLQYSAGSFTLGGADAASAVAQTLKVQSVVAGTSNTAGADLTIKGSAGTGTGAGGKIIFQVAPAGTTGTSQNALATAFTITSSGATATPMVADGSLGLLTGSYSGNSAQWGVFNSAGNTVKVLFDAFGRVLTTSGGIFGFSSTSAANGTIDAQITRGGAGTIQLGAADAAAPVAQALQVQSVVAGTSNTSGVDWAQKLSAGTGTGAGGKLIWYGSPAGTTGTTQNSKVAAWGIDGNALAIYPAATLATTMTTGFINIPGAAGAPSGTPANTTGFPMYWDSTNFQLYIYSGAAWKKSAAFT